METNMNKKGQGAVIGVGFVVLAVLALFTFLLGFDVVDASHKGVMIRFGTILGVQNPGMQWTGLFTHVEEYDLRTRKQIIDLQGDNGAATKEGQDVYATINVNYRLKGDTETISKVYSNIGRDENIADVLNLNAIITEAVKQNTVKYDWVGILDRREELKDKIVVTIKEHFPNEYFTIESIVITNIGFSSRFEEELEAKQLATQTALKEQNQLEAVKFQQQQSLEVIKTETEKLKLQGLQLNELLIKQQWIAKWDGHVPAYLITSPENANFLMSLPQGGK